ncbi:MAG: PRC-barrel domain-containing protein [Balneolaceae bacterium]|jgi:sporulation protein YlmC with PRC-barrel domain
MKPSIKLATELMGTKIKTRSGEEVGVVQNLMIDPQKGTIIFMVLCYANFIGKVHRFFAIPRKMLTVKHKDDMSIYLEIEKEKLVNAQTDASGGRKNEYIMELISDEPGYPKNRLHSRN